MATRHMLGTYYGTKWGLPLSANDKQDKAADRMVDESQARDTASEPDD